MVIAKDPSSITHISALAFSFQHGSAEDKAELRDKLIKCAQIMPKTQDQLIDQGMIIQALLTSKNGGVPVEEDILKGLEIVFTVPDNRKKELLDHILYDQTCNAAITRKLRSIMFDWEHPQKTFIFNLLLERNDEFALNLKRIQDEAFERRSAAIDHFAAHAED